MHLGPWASVCAIYDGGMADTYVDSYYMLVDSGDVKESDYLLGKAKKQDAVQAKAKELTEMTLNQITKGDM